MGYGLGRRGVKRGKPGRINTEESRSRGPGGFEGQVSSNTKVKAGLRGGVS